MIYSFEGLENKQSWDEIAGTLISYTCLQVKKIREIFEIDTLGLGEIKKTVQLF